MPDGTAIPVTVPPTPRRYVVPTSGQLAVGTTPAPVRFTPGTTPVRSLVLTNPGSATSVYVGGFGVSILTGLAVLPSASPTIIPIADGDVLDLSAFYAVASSATTLTFYAGGVR